MAFSSHRKQFKGTLANVPVEELGKLDYEREALAERKEYIEEKYKKVSEFYAIYIGGDDEAEFYKVGLNKDDDLSADINIFQHIEKDGSYLLNSKDLPRDKQHEYKLLSERDFKEILKREKNFTCLGVQSGIEENNGVMEILEPKKANDYTNMDHKITKKDLVDPRTMVVLGSYEKVREYLKEELRKIKNKEESPLTLYQVRRLLKGINDDMIKCKIVLKGIRSPAKRLGDESGKFYTEMIDYNSEHHIKAILKTIRLTSELEPDSELSHIAYDMKVAINTLHKEGYLDELDLEIIDCYNSGYSNVATGKELDLSERMVRYRLNKIFKKICNFYKKV